MPRLFSYVVDHDNGFAPNPFGGFCTLAKCKYGTPKKPNIVELAQNGDWVVGTGGATGFRRGESAGIGKLIYAMRVDEKLPLSDYCRRYEGKRIDARRPGVLIDGRFALISRHFFYFGRNALQISEIPARCPDHSLEKRGPGFRSDFDQSFIHRFTTWLGNSFRVGIHGMPCKPNEGIAPPRCAPKVRRRAC